MRESLFEYGQAQQIALLKAFYRQHMPLTNFFLFVWFIIKTNTIYNEIHTPKKKKKSLKCKTFANTNFQTSTNTTNLIYKPKYYNFKLKQLFQTTQVHHIITNVQSSQQTHDRI